MEARQTPLAELHYGITRTAPEKDESRLGSYRREYVIGLGSEKQLLPWANASRFVRQKNISSWANRMSKDAILHYQRHLQEERQPMEAGRICFQIQKIGDKTIAFAHEYYPKDKLKKFRRDKEGRGSGINAALIEADCLEHLRKELGVTHMTTTDGFYGAGTRGGKSHTSQERQDQLRSHGIEPKKTYTIDEWIRLLKETPDCSQIKGYPRIEL